MRFPLPGLLALLPATATLLPLPAQAGPYLYVGITTISSAQACLDRAEALLKKYKLTEGLEVDRKEHFEAYGDHRDLDMSAKVNCWAKKGVAAIGFAGSNNDDVWNTYSRFIDEF